jgi:dTDP-glucose 4,6-dehydratase
MKTMLVTGGAGFIGSGFIRYYFHKYPDCKIMLLDALTYAGNPDNLPQELKESNRFG